jgi:hypothetical protein
MLRDVGFSRLDEGHILCAPVDVFSTMRSPVTVSLAG